MARVYRLKAGLEMPDSGLPGAPSEVDCAGIGEGADVENWRLRAFHARDLAAEHAESPAFRTLAVDLAVMASGRHLAALPDSPPIPPELPAVTEAA
jgi:hypothetical protein